MNSQSRFRLLLRISCKVGIFPSAAIVFILVPLALSLHRLTIVQASSSTAAATSPQRLPWVFSTSTRRPGASTVASSSSILSCYSIPENLRGGENIEEEDDGVSDADEFTADNDEERYSRQVYTLGARAHGLVRSSTVYVDGPVQSGLLWESLKNLALSGVGRLVILIDHDEEDDIAEDATTATRSTTKYANAYHNADLDDLGRTYLHGARAELELDGGNRYDSDATESLADILVEFIFRLNPALQVSTMSRSQFLELQQQLLTGRRENALHNNVLLCIDRPYSVQEEWNEKCRSSMAFVSAETHGVYGRVFCDFGPKHEIYDGDGETSLVIPLDIVEKIAEQENTSGSGGNVDSSSTSTSSTILLVKCVDGERHDVSKGDIIQFQRSDGSLMEALPCTVTKVKTPELIHVKLDVSTTTTTSPFNEEDIIRLINQQAVSFSRVKQVEEMNFVSLKDATQRSMDPESGNQVFTPCDLDKSFDETRRKAVFGCFQTLNTFVTENGRLPTANDWESFSVMANAQSSNEEWTQHCRNFVNTCQAKFVPLQAIFGAIASQECLKAVSGLYNPIHQFLLYDCDEVLPSVLVQNDDGPSSDVDDMECTSGLAYILGKDAENLLSDKKIFVVGSGAIGCEILKNLAAMGAGTGKRGAIIVTDMDTIEKSNLSRQLLFRDSDIGKFKSKAAEEAVNRLNPSVRMECHTSKVGDDDNNDPGPFDGKFWSKRVDVVLNALDNVDARLFMDGQCVANGKALVDAGTLGSKGNVQVVVPFKSESYGSSSDPPEPAIPVCTLKNFPYAISHTIQWGRDLFDGLFVRRPRQVNQYASVLAQISINEFASKLEHDLGDQAAWDAAKELSEDMKVQMDSTASNVDQETFVKQQAIAWAVGLAQELFCDTIHQLLVEHPVDSLDDDGEKFWSGSRKMPRALSFSTHVETEGEIDAVVSTQQDDINKNLIEFVRSAARLRYESYMGIPTRSSDNLSLVTSEMAVEGLVGIFGVAKSHTTSNREESDHESIQYAIQKRLASLESYSVPPDKEMLVAEFEKDDESNDHIAFIAAASNLRAICYGIPPVTVMETRKVAGKIVPAMITTTAFVSALSCIELIKLVQPATPLHKHRNAFINLALPFFAFTSPLPAEPFAGLRGATHTLWDRIDIQESKKSAQRGGLTLRKLLKRIRQEAYEPDPDIVQVSSMSVGPYMVYANFLHEDDDDLLDTSIWRVVEEAVVSGDQFDDEYSRDASPWGEGSSSNETSELSLIDLMVVVEDVETGEEIELPPVRVRRSTSSAS